MTDSCEVVVLGCEHFATWDGTNGHPDILSPRRQLELDDLVDRLARFRPTKVAVELLPSRQAELDHLVATWSPSTASRSRNEIAQVAARLLRRVEATAHAVDADWTLQWEGVQHVLDEHPAERPTGDVSAVGREILNALALERSQLAISDFLQELNSDVAVKLNDQEYLDTWLMVGAGQNWGGVDLVASWYRRNLRIFGNLRRVVAPSDRVVLLFGVGHAWSLRHFIDTSREFTLVPVAHVLR